MSSSSKCQSQRIRIFLGGKMCRLHLENRCQKMSYGMSDTKLELEILNCRIYILFLFK